MDDFWRTGKGIAARLEKLGIYTMGDIARRSLDHNGIEELYKEFGKPAELLDRKTLTEHFDISDELYEKYHG